MAMMNPIAFFRQVKQEVAKITWPTRVVAFHMTLVIMFMCVVLGFYFLAADWISATSVKLILGIGA